MVAGSSGRFIGIAVAIAVSTTCLASMPPASASASESPPKYDGLLDFPEIHGPSDPEEFTWQVELNPGETLKDLDDQTVGIFSGGGQQSGTILAEAAHDANGVTVPTSISTGEGDLVTEVVHHRAGNPAASGAPFDYPILAGPGWERGFKSVVIEGPPDEAEIREAQEALERAARASSQTLPGEPDSPAVKSHPAVRACGRVGGVPVHAHGITCRTARRVYRADQRGAAPAGWACSASLARCYRGELGSHRFVWWRRSY